MNKQILIKIYDYLMIVVIVISLVPLLFVTENIYLRTIDYITAAIFIIDYLARWFTHLRKGLKDFFTYPFTPMAIIDLLSILPSLTILNKAFKVLRVLRLFRAFRVLKFFRYSKNIKIIQKVLSKQKGQLLTVGGLALAYIFISALVVFQVEPHTFGDFFNAIYWATVSLTTVGYGDIYPVSEIGKMFSMLSSFFGIAVVALPAGIIVSGYTEEIETK